MGNAACHEYTSVVGAFFDGLIDNYHTYSCRYRFDIKRFFSDLSILDTARLQYKRESDRFLSSDFNIFDYLNTDENAISDYIATILDCNGVHGQGNLFSSLFIDFLLSNGIEVPKVDYKIHREYFANGRIDVFLEYRDRCIIIENKPYTFDQPQQLSRYIDYISESYKHVCVIYLSNGKGPSEFSIEPNRLAALKIDKQFLTISLFTFGDEFLKKCLTHCASQKYRFFIGDFRSFLMNSFYMTEEVKRGTIQ